MKPRQSNFWKVFAIPLGIGLLGIPAMMGVRGLVKRRA